ncbi:thiamine biosynthesis protein MoeB [Bacillus sp. AFS002410]|uniref:ThiF family adenylyltransferase n=1 Tax=Bacillus sp. AFS002410 TaxID=2033481 RepID=UPI000BEFE75B|nr:ThiF family adenylyltransferase [Bacillus sp. AFS002410]PEJ56809.1 thiamine biosynthesis protein MoeB [Bacillus sp. AFS002410]
MINRYAKQELFLGTDRQLNLQKASAIIIGVGALGSSIAEMLVRAGIGNITIVDRDYVEWSNLQRQSLYTEEDAKNKLPKVIAAKNRLQQINSEVTINSFITDITSLNIEELIKDQTIILDATDNFETRMVVNDAAIKHGIPFIFGACVGSYGLSFPIIPGKTPCLNCLLNHIPTLNMTCDTVGVISPIVQMIAAYQVTYAMQYLTNYELSPILQSIDVWKHEKSDINIERLKNHNCPTCGPTRSYPYLNDDHQMKSYVLCGRDAVQLSLSSTNVPSLRDLSERLIGLVNDLIVNPYLLACTFEDHRIVLFKDGRAIIHGTKEAAVAKELYRKIII